MTDTRDTHRPFWGKYRGKVIDNVDPMFMGRIMANVPAMPGSLLNWALPCTPYAGPNVGFYAIPPIGANVWIEFEGGDPDYPIWTGCFWAQEDVLQFPEPFPPETKIFKTESVSLILSDLPEVGGFTLKCDQPAVDMPLSMQFTSEGITLATPGATIRMAPEGITLTAPDSAVSITPEVISIALSPASLVLSSEAITIEAPVLEISGAANLNDSLNVDGLTTLSGGLAVLGGGTVDGAPII